MASGRGCNSSRRYSPTLHCLYALMVKNGHTPVPSARGLSRVARRISLSLRFESSYARRVSSVRAARIKSRGKGYLRAKGIFTNVGYTSDRKGFRATVSVRSGDPTRREETRFVRKIGEERYRRIRYRSSRRRCRSRSCLCRGLEPSFLVRAVKRRLQRRRAGRACPPNLLRDTPEAIDLSATVERARGTFSLSLSLSSLQPQLH